MYYNTPSFCHPEAQIIQELHVEVVYVHWPALNNTSANNITAPLPLSLITRRCVQQTCITSEWIPLQLLPIFPLSAGNQASMINVAGMIRGCPPLFGVPTGAPLFPGLTVA